LGPLDRGAITKGYTNPTVTVTPTTVAAGTGPDGQPRYGISLKIAVNQQIYINSRYKPAPNLVDEAKEALERSVRGGYGHEQRHLQNGIAIAIDADRAAQGLVGTTYRTKAHADDWGQKVADLIKTRIEVDLKRDAQHNYAKESVSEQNYPVIGKMPPPIN